MPSGQDIVDLARKSLGVQYVWGGNSLSSGIDCSGLVQQVYKRFGINLPRVTYDQINVGQSVSPGKLRPGDLVFFDTDRSHKGPDHVGIYLGGGKFIHAPRPGQGVKISSLSDSYYMDRWMAGRRIPGVNAQRSQGFSAGAETAAPRLTRSELAETYGMSVAFFNSQPELKKLLGQAVDGQWTPTRFQAEVKNTSWWKDNSKSAREAQVLKKGDPATYTAKIEAARVAAEQMANQVGAIMSDSKLDELAKNMVTFNWNDAMVGNFLGQFIKFTDKGTLGGTAGAAQQEIMKTAYGLGIRTTKQTVLNQAQYLVRGLTTMENIKAGMRQQAAGMYPAFADQIEAGANLEQIAQPYISVLASELDLPSTDLNVYTPKIRDALNHVGKDGQAEPLSLGDFRTLVRSDPRWAKTPQATESAFSTGRQVLAIMGLGL